MQQVYRKRQKIILCFFGFVLILFLFFSLQPATRSMFEIYSVNNTRQILIDKTIERGSIDPQLFWETREFSAPGAFHFEREGLTKKQISEALSKQPMKIIAKSFYPFLTFTSSKWESVEFLTEQTELKKVLSENQSICTKIIFQTPSELICALQDGSTYIAFIKPIDQMKKANAFFDFAGRDGVIVEGKNWLSISKIVTN